MNSSGNEQHLAGTATVALTNANGTGPINAGTVTFSLLQGNIPVAGSTPITVPVTNGQAALTSSDALLVPANTPAGNYTIQASYTDSQGKLVASAPATKQLTINTSPPGTSPPSPPSGSPPPAPPPPPPLKTPPLLAFFDRLLAATETVNADGSVTETASFFGIPLLVSTFDSSGHLESVLLFGINVTALFELL